MGLVQAIVIADQGRRYRLLSRNSQLTAQSLHDVWQQELYLPIKTATQKRPNLGERIAIFGGRKRWPSLTGTDQGVKEDAARMGRTDGDLGIGNDGSSRPNGRDDANGTAGCGKSGGN